MRSVISNNDAASPDQEGQIPSLAVFNYLNPVFSQKKRYK